MIKVTLTLFEIQDSENVLLSKLEPQEQRIKADDGGVVRDH